jgi:hypothetical protein
MASAAAQLQAKIRLERIFKKSIKRIFNAIAKDFATAVAVRGTPIDASIYKQVWMAALDTHYSRVQKIFTGVALPQRKQRDDEEDNKKEILLLALLMWRKQQVDVQASYIINTTRNNMSEAIRIANEQFAADGRIPTHRELALAAVAVLKRRLAGRIDTIAITETQGAAESTKFADAEVESGITPRVLGGSAIVATTKKTWITMGDSRVRPIHAVANGQTRALTEPFLVNGEYLMYPRDNSLGASYGNTARCRCEAMYSLL